MQTSNIILLSVIGLVLLIFIPIMIVQLYNTKSSGRRVNILITYTIIILTLLVIILTMFNAIQQN